MEDDTFAAEYAKKQQMVQPLAAEVNAFRVLQTVELSQPMARYFSSALATGAQPLASRPQD
jgi:hypothetical protein